MKYANKNQWLLYGSGSILFLFIPIFTSPDFNWNTGFFHIHPFQRSLISYTFLLLFFYAQMFVFLPKFYFAKRLIIFWICILISFLVCALLPIALLPTTYHMHPFKTGGAYPPPPDNGLVFLLTRNLFQFLVVGFFSYSLQVNAQWKSAERARTDAELGYLKAQINPHFLFNTLNSIYSLAIQHSDKTADAVVQLSSMMRYVLSEASKDFVSLQKEIEYISDYISLQQTRLSDNVDFSYEISGEAGNQLIAPMLLIPFIENTYKYGVNPDENCEIKINFIITPRELQMHTFNKKVKFRSIHSESNKMGIENTRKRLLSLYPKQHKLLIHDEGNSFSIFLSIALK
ncbi:MAG: histidine kinase [Chitinophagaceae bacterium]